MRLKKEMLAAIAAMGAFLLWIGGSSFAQTPEADLPTTSEAEAAAYMKGQELVIEVEIGLGQGKATARTCDLTHGYISINADYRS